MHSWADKQRFKLYLAIGGAFTLLWLFGHLVSDPDRVHIRLANELWRNAYLLIIIFIFYEKAWPSVLRKRRFLLYNIGLGLLVLWAMMMLLSFGLYAWRQAGVGIGVYTPLREDKSIEEALSYQMQGGMAALVFFGIVRHLYDHYKLKQSAQQLRLEKQEAELQYLRSQTNPHFLFNTLNNIYSLSRDKSDLAPESILRLSKILRFMLYEAGSKYVSIGQELKVINDYIALEKLRYDETLRVNINNDVEDMQQSLPPLLLIPLVENAFKHGVSETRDDPFVDVHLSVRNRQLMFVVKNSAERQYAQPPAKENIGLSNLRRQLQLLYKEYTLITKSGDGVFTATLTINLASHA